LLRDGTISHVAVIGRHPVLVTELASYPPYAAPPLSGARDAAARAGFSALLSVPLVSVSGHVAGALNLYRDRAHAWDWREIGYASDYAEHAAAGILVGANVEGRRREVAALQGFSDAHACESHEYANRLHALSGLLAIDEVDAARAFLEELTAPHHDGVAFVVGRIQNPAIAQAATELSVSTHTIRRWPPSKRLRGSVERGGEPHRVATMAKGPLPLSFRRRAETLAKAERTELCLTPTCRLDNPRALAGRHGIHVVELSALQA
jgi:hypothetical protein